MRVTIKIRGEQAPEDRYDERGSRTVPFANLSRVEMDPELAAKTLRHLADQIEQTGRLS